MFGCSIRDTELGRSLGVQGQSGLHNVYQTVGSCGDQGLISFPLGALRMNSEEGGSQSTFRDYKGVE